MKVEGDWVQTSLWEQWIGQATLYNMHGDLQDQMWQLNPPSVCLILLMQAFWFS